MRKLGKCEFITRCARPGCSLTLARARAAHRMLTHSHSPAAASASLEAYYREPDGAQHLVMEARPRASMHAHICICADVPPLLPACTAHVRRRLDGRPAAEAAQGAGRRCAVAAQRRDARGDVARAEGAGVHALCQKDPAPRPEARQRAACAPGRGRLRRPRHQQAGGHGSCQGAGALFTCLLHGQGHRGVRGARGGHRAASAGAEPGALLRLRPVVRGRHALYHVRPKLAVRARPLPSSLLHCCCCCCRVRVMHVRVCSTRADAPVRFLRS
jgi:hypothetical protein